MNLTTDNLKSINFERKTWKQVSKQVNNQVYVIPWNTVYDQVYDQLINIVYWQLINPINNQIRNLDPKKDIT